jgi:hypothetical protein
MLVHSIDKILRDVADAVDRSQMPDAVRKTLNALERSTDNARAEGDKRRRRRRPKTAAEPPAKKARR